MTVDSLIDQVAGGSEKALSELMTQSSDRVYGVAIRLLGDEDSARDCLVDVFSTVWDKAKFFRNTGQKGETWLISIARNRAIDIKRRNLARKRDNKETISIDDIDDQYVDIIPILTDSLEERLNLDQCLGKLQVSHAQAIRLAYLDGFTYDELAKAFLIPINTMKSWLRRGLAKLRECLEDG